MSSIASVRASAEPRLRLRLSGRVVLLVSLAAAAAVLIQGLWIVAWGGPWYGDFRMMTLFVVLGAVACHFPVEVTPRYKTNVSTAVHFAMLLLFPAPIAVGLVGISVLLGNGTLALRRNPDGHRRRGVYDTIFNASQMMTATGIGALALYWQRPETPAALVQASDVWAVPLAAAAMYVSTTGAVASAVGYHTRRKPIDVWLEAQRFDGPSEAALYLIGFITAIVTMRYGWAPIAMAIPTAIVYLSTKRGVLLTKETIEAIEALADTVDRRDPYTFEHSKRVAANAAVIAPAMGLSPEQVAAIRLAARVHDLGKLALPDSVLLKEGRLTDDEFALMKAHPRHGYEILARFPQYHKGREMVLRHHERVDGGGYPGGLTAERIPLGAQIIAVADALDAMTSDRPYRAAMPLHQAMTELRLGRGKQWSPAVVDTVERLLNIESRALSFGSGALALTTAGD